MKSSSVLGNSMVSVLTSCFALVYVQWSCVFLPPEFPPRFLHFHRSSAHLSCNRLWQVNQKWPAEEPLTQSISVWTACLGHDENWLKIPTRNVWKLLGKRYQVKLGLVAAVSAFWKFVQLGWQQLTFKELDPWSKGLAVVHLAVWLWNSQGVIPAVPDENWRKIQTRNMWIWACQTWDPTHWE